MSLRFITRASSSTSEVVGDGLDPRRQERLAALEAVDLEPRNPLQDDAEVVLGQLDDLEDAGGAAHVVHICLVRILGARILLREDADHRALLGDRVLHEADGLAPPDVDRNDRTREQHGVAERENGDHVRDLDRKIAACLGFGHRVENVLLLAWPVKAGNYKENRADRRCRRTLPDAPRRAWGRLGAEGPCQGRADELGLVRPIGKTTMSNATAVVTHPEDTAPTATGAVFDTILADIVRGAYPPGARLPAERELARQLGASRPTLREALRMLSEWQLVESRRGSGVVVRDRRDWSIEVLPAYLRYASPAPGEPSITRMLADLLALRRSMIRDMIGIVAERMPPGGTTRAKAALARAWAVRAEPRAFADEDFAVMREVVEAAELLPALWLLNRLSGVYLEIARTITGAVRPPDDYLASHERVFAALEARDPARAREAMADYLDRHDRHLLAAMGVTA
jgi:GntR family transcriptional regulator, transcriptional repressor for pyruvate dehydrogenase complex